MAEIFSFPAKLSRAAAKKQRHDRGAHQLLQKALDSNLYRGEYLIHLVSGLYRPEIFDQRWLARRHPSWQDTAADLGALTRKWVDWTHRRALHTRLTDALDGRVDPHEVLADLTVALLGDGDQRQVS